MASSRQIGWILVFFTLVVLGCGKAVSPSRGGWTATPEVVRATRSTFEVSVAPRKGEYPYYAFFSVAVTNTGDADLVIDWNQSRYLFNGRAQGTLVFQGIDPGAVKTATVPPEIVAPGKSLTRLVSPMKLIAWSPLKEKTAGEKSITPGIIPAGENGIRLVLLRAGDPISFTGSFTIRQVTR